jgi:hypothetical protein
MQITTVAYGKTFNLGHYQSERIDLTATLAEGDDATLAALLLKAEVLRLGGDERGAQDAIGDAACRRAELAEATSGKGAQ